MKTVSRLSIIVSGPAVPAFAGARAGAARLYVAPALTSACRFLRGQPNQRSKPSECTGARRKADSPHGFAGIPSNTLCWFLRDRQPRFAMVPMNLLHRAQPPVWKVCRLSCPGACGRDRLSDEARKIGSSTSLPRPRADQFHSIPRADEISLVGPRAYVHMTSNNKRSTARKGKRCRRSASGRSSTTTLGGHVSRPSTSRNMG